MNPLQVPPPPTSLPSSTLLISPYAMQASSAAQQARWKAQSLDTLDTMLE